jgi:hypothetical protein
MPTPVWTSHAFPASCMLLISCKFENKYGYFVRASHNIDEQGRGTRFSASTLLFIYRGGMFFGHFCAATARHWTT